MNFRGIGAILISVIAIVGFIIWIPALKYVLGGAVVIGLVIAFGLRVWHDRKPVKDPEEESIKLHLND